MKSLEQKFEENYLLGCIKYNNQCDVFLMPLAYWILNYFKYDPSYDPKHWPDVFRNNILNVVDEDVNSFLNVINEDRLSWSDVKYAIQNIPNEHTYVYFFIDFDEKIFISQHDTDIENNLPDASWKGIYDNPLKFVPENLKDILKTKD